MSLFITDTNEIEIFIKLWDKCPTACLNCWYANAPLKFYDINIIKKNIYSCLNITSNNIRFFLYWVDTFSCDYLEELLDYIYSFWRKVLIQIDYRKIIWMKDYINLLISKYSWIEFLIARTIQDKIDLSLIIQSIKFVSSNFTSTTFRYDLIINTEKYGKIFNLLINKFSSVQDINMHDNYSFYLNNISWSISKEISIDSKNSIINNISFKDCVLKSFFLIEWNKINLFDSIEVDFDWNFRIHTPICFLWDIKISNINFSNKKILDDFSKFNLYINSRDYSVMWKSCYDCIKSPYVY